MKRYKKPLAKFIALNVSRILAGSLDVSQKGTNDVMSKSASFSFGDDDE